MNKNIVIVMLLVIIFVMVGWLIYNRLDVIDAELSFNEQVENNNTYISEENKNVIDQYYLQRLNEDLSMYELNYIADKYMTAWKNEFQNVVNNIKNELTYIQDKEIFDKYYEQYEELAMKSAEAEHLKFVDTKAPISDRFAGSGASYSELLSMTKIYKQGAMNLIEYFETSQEGKEYNYIFRGEK